MTRRENTLLALQGKVPEYVPCYFSDIQSFSTPFHGEGIMVPGVATGMDGYGVQLSDTLGGAPTPTPGVPPVIKDITKWRESLILPDYKTIDWKTVANAENARRGANSEEFVQDFIYPKGPFERLHFLLGFEEALCAILDEPEEVEALLTAIVDNKIEFIHCIADAYQPDYITLMDDYAHQEGLLMSPSMFRELFKPQLKRLVDAVHSHGIKYKQHCCGKMELLTKDFVDIGIDAIDPVQPMNDIFSMQELLAGKVGICGGLDVQNVIDREGVTEEELRAEVRRCLNEYGEKGGFTLYCATVGLRKPSSYQPSSILFSGCSSKYIVLANTALLYVPESLDVKVNTNISSSSHL